MASKDYTGREVDLFIAQGVKESGSQLLTLGFDGVSGGKVTTGAQKAVQTFLILFLTEKGTRAHDPEFGSSFLTQVRSSNINDAQLPITFRDAAEEILEQQERFRTTTNQDDEVLERIDLLNFSIPSPSEMKLTVLLTTVAGTSRQVILPVSLAIK